MTPVPRATSMAPVELALLLPSSTSACYRCRGRYQAREWRMDWQMSLWDESHGEPRACTLDPAGMHACMLLLPVEAAWAAIGTCWPDIAYACTASHVCLVLTR